MFLSQSDREKTLCQIGLRTIPGQRVTTYGTTTLNLDHKLRRKFSWQFVIANVDNHWSGLSAFLWSYAVSKKPPSRRHSDKSHLRWTDCYHGTSGYHKILTQFSNITRSSFIGRTVQHDVVHNIETTPGPPIFSKPRRLASDRLKVAEFQHLLEQGIIRLLKSPWAPSLHLVPKKDQGWQSCGDYYALNARIVPERYLLPHIEDFVQILPGKIVFSIVDLMRAYHQTPVTSDDIPKTVVTTPFRQFEFMFISFGLRTSGQTFQH